MDTTRSRFVVPHTYQAVPLGSESSPVPYTEPQATRTSLDATESNSEMEPSSRNERLFLHTRDRNQLESKQMLSSGSLGSTKPSSTTSKSSERWWNARRTANQWWLYELLAAVVSLACFATLVGVLRRSDGKQQTRWLYKRLTLNSLIALLSTFIRAAMMFSVGACLSQMKWNHFSIPSQAPQPRRLQDLDIFDQASRGPLGSLRLMLYQTRTYLGVLGAIITIFTLAFDAFAQEVIILEFQNQPGIAGTLIGDIARSEKYDQWTKVGQETNWGNDLNTIAAEYNGIFNYQNITAPVAQCSTGNCTWPIVPSLAMCGSCTDVSSSITYDCVGNSFDAAEDNANCTYTLSEGRYPAYGGGGYNYGYTFSSTPSGESVSGQPVLAFTVVGNYVTQHYNNSKYAYIDNWLMINASYGDITASVCGLWFCVQAYESNISNGVPTQNIVGNWSETDISPDTRDGGYGLVNFTNVPPSMREHANFSIDANVLTAFGQNAIFANGSITYGTDGPFFYLYSSSVVRSLQAIKDYDAWIDRFALGMSNNIRSTGTSSTPVSKYAGTVLTSVPLVRVRWPWLSFPAAMVTASLSLLAACIWQTSHLDVRPWKGDTLALLLASLDEDIEQDAANRRKTEKQKVWLKAQDDNAVFRKAPV